MAVENEAATHTGVDEASVENRLEAHFAGKPAAKPSPKPTPEPPAIEVDDPEAQDVEASDEVTPDDIQDDDEELTEDEAGTDPDGIEIPYNGEPVRISQDKIRDYVQQGYHLERAREAIASELTGAQTSARQITEAVKAIESTAPQLQNLRTRMDAMEMFATEMGLTPNNILAVSRQDPARAQEMQAELNVRVAEYRALSQQRAELEQLSKRHGDAVKQEMERAELALLSRLNPNLKDPVQRDKARTMLAEQMSKWRETSVEMAMNNAEVLDLLIDGAKYRTLQKSKKAITAVAQKAPAVLRPGSATTVAQGKTSREQKLRARLKTTGSADDFASLLLSKGFK